MNISKPFDTTTFRDRISVIRRGMDKQSTLSLSRSNLVETTTLPYLHGREKRANRGGARDRLGGGRSTALPRVSERILRRRVHAEPPPPRAVLRLQPRRLRRLVRRARRPALRRLIRVEIAFFDAERCTRELSSATTELFVTSFSSAPTRGREGVAPGGGHTALDLARAFQSTSSSRRASPAPAEPEGAMSSSSGAHTARSRASFVRNSASSAALASS